MSETDNATKAFLIEADMRDGVKRTYADLNWYVTHRLTEFETRRQWRHRESQTVYTFNSLGLACTGNGKLVLMVHYVPYGEVGPVFERQYLPFLERFEPVEARTVWEAA